MIRFNVKVDIAAFKAAIRPVFEKNVMDFFSRFVSRIHFLLRLPKHGIHYKRLPFRSSAPGQPPRAQFGRLEGSIQRPVFSNLKATIDITAPYARRLEFGFDPVLGSIAPRPYVRPAVEGVLTAIRNSFRRP